jgi:hypothetical protein
MIPRRSGPELVGQRMHTTMRFPQPAIRLNLAAGKVFLNSICSSTARQRNVAFINGYNRAGRKL